MVMEASDLNDSYILQNTKQETNDEGKVRYEFNLPTGRPLTSEWMNPNEMKGTIVIKWCDLVREQVSIDLAEERAAKKRGSVEPEDISESVKEDSVSDVTNPVDYARHQRDLYQERCNILDQRISDMKIERSAARRHLEQWEKIVDGLRGEVDE